MNPYHETNRQSWNRATRAHNRHRGDQVAAFRAGFNSLYPEEMKLLGDLSGKTVVHLQCNAGQDTLSVKRHLHAQRVVGVDISDEATTFARDLSRQSGIDADFVRADVFDWFAANTERFDVVFMSYGTVCWLSDLTRWAAGIVGALKPGGRFVFVEFHPMMTMFETDWTLTYPAIGGRHTGSPGVGDYIGESYDKSSGEVDEGDNAAHEFNWGVGDVLDNLLRQGLEIRHFQEYDFANGWKMAPDMQVLERWKEHGQEKQRVTMPGRLPRIAMMYSVVGRRPRSPEHLDESHDDEQGKSEHGGDVEAHGHNG